MTNKITKGFTLVELMIVVAIIGILASVAIPGFMKYIKDSKTTEAKTNLKAIADGALSYYSTEHATDSSGKNYSSKEFPYVNSCKSKASGGTCIYSAFVPTTIPDTGTKKTITTNAEPWISLNFQITAPVYYSYGYFGTSAYFYAQAAAKLDSKTNVDSCFKIKAQGAYALSDATKISAIRDLSNRSKPCENSLNSIIAY